MWTKTSVDASNATASQIYSPEEAQEILAMQDKALMWNPKEYELTDAEWNRIPLDYATLVASHEFRDEETNKNYIDQLFQLNDKYYHSAADTEWNLEIYKELNRDAAEDLLRDSSLELTDAGKKLFPDIPVNSDKGTVLTFPEESLKDEEPIDFSNVEMERFSETEKGSYLLMPTAELLDQILDRMSTVNVVVSKKEATLPMPKREELDESECILYVDTNEEQTAADLHFADPKSGFQTAVPLLQPEEATLIAIANNLEKQIENFEKAIDVVADAINTHTTEQDAIEKA